jgi:sterol desaturase/sphingolipid hydroxylase (fatty acid hydroxylase superfamily)
VFLVALSVRSRIVFGLVLVALIFVPLEKLWALHPQRTFRKGWASDVVHFVVNNLLSTIGIVVAVVAIGSGLAAVRLHPIDQAFTRSCFVIPLYALGFTRATFGALLVLFALQALFIHANVRLTFGPLRYVLATPEFHHWHHAGDPVV